MLRFYKIFAEKFGKSIGVFAHTVATFCKNFMTLVFEKNAIFCRKLAKITT
jgi:hypothetical protein